MARKPRGVDQLQSGHWRARAWDPAVRRTITAPVTFATAKAAGAWIEETRTALRRGTYVAPLTMTVLDQVRAHGAGRARTWVSLASRLKDDPLGAMRLQDVRPSHVEAWVRRQTGAPTTVRLYCKLLSAAFGAAVDDRLLGSSPFTPKLRRYAVPKTPPPKRDTLTIEDVGRLADAVPARYRMLVVVMGLCGLRVSESVALRVDDLDVRTRTLHVERQHDRRNQPAPLKHHGAPREVPVPAWFVDEWADHVRLFPSERGLLSTSRFGNPVDVHTFGHLHWPKAVAGARVPETLTPKDLRHHAASRLLSEGVPVTTVAKMLGHSVQVLSQTYAHAMPAGDDLARMAMEASWSSWERQLSPGLSR